MQKQQNNLLMLLDTKIFSQNISFFIYFYESISRRIKNENKIAKKEQKKIDDEKNAMLQKRRSDIDLLKKRTGIDNHALVAYYYDTDKIDELLKIAKYRQDNGLIKIRNKDEQRIVKSHGGKITGGFDYFMISTI